MRLSDAIRLGSMMKPQNHGAFYGKKLRVVRRDSFPWFQIETVDTSCAIGAAFDSSRSGYRITTHRKGETVKGFRGGRRVLKQDETLEIWTHPDEWNAVWYEQHPCPQCRRIEPTYSLLPHLNDHHGWTREAIADFVESVENQQYPVTEVLETAEAVPQNR